MPRSDDGTYMIPASPGQPYEWKWIRQYSSETGKWETRKVSVQVPTYHRQTNTTAKA